MNRRDFIRKLVICGGTIGLLGKLLDPNLLRAEPFSNALEYYRIVVLGDPHLPVREREVKDLTKRHKIVDAKNKVVEDINSWEDVKQINVMGDIVAQFGTVEEYAYARQYFARFNKPISFIVGNHDYIYADAFSTEGKFIRADAVSREQKLNRFKEAFGQSVLFYSQTVGRYLLIFLSPDSLESSHLTQISEQQLVWFRNELEKHPAAPTIIFFHAPLAGTLLNYNKDVNTPNFIVQPKDAVEKIINDNPQILLWVSGHTHTSATNPSYASSVNAFGGRLTNIHNADMDRETIWTNSLYLYPNKVLIKTFNHKEKVWEADLERTIYI
ncbi:3',5'-cyclic adenosine monophosphate phosphodiesterase CpdA [Sporomusa rhizae]